MPGRRPARRHRRRSWRTACGPTDEEVRHLVAVRLPGWRNPTSVHAASVHPDTGLRYGRLTGTDFAESLDCVVERYADAVENAQTRVDHAAKAALKASMRPIQALANKQQVSISEMQDRHDHPDVLRDLLEIDRANAQSAAGHRPSPYVRLLWGCTCCPVPSPHCGDGWM
ncbi:hypothetical protein [Streptomyces sp. ISL-10]|uniref:hypothetical protein n=1 Tax=Streptomyces sp. ISL-10 TaxID=2819172 RepID=UPI0027E3E44A|nr:hypothetical protein [Streptomyces sp. ISL-10]